MTSEVKLMGLQKQVEDLKRKLRDSTHEKVQAINRSNQDWERKLVSQTAISLKKLQAEHDLKMTSLQSDIGLHVGREVATATSEKDSQIRRIKETIDNEGSAVRVACFKTEDKYSEIIKRIESEWKTRETSLTREIFHLSGEREEIANQLAVLKQSDIEKAAIIKSLNFDHEKVVKELIDVSKQDQYKEYTKFKSLEKYAQDKESEVKRLEGKVDLLKVDKEILEKQLQTIKKLYSSPDSSPTVPRILRYTEREREQNKRIRDLEEKLRLSSRNRGGSTMSNYSIDSSPIPNIHSPSHSVSPDSFDSIKQLKRQNRELREQLKLSQQINLETEKQSVPKETEYLQKEVNIKEKNDSEISDISSITESSRIEDTDIQEQHFKQLYRESILTQQTYSLWCEGNSGTAEFEDLKSENRSQQIRCDSLKSEYTSILLQNNKLIHDRDQVLADNNTIENKYEILQSTMDRKELRIKELEIIEIEVWKLRESNETLISQQEGFTLLIDKQIQEIDLLKPYESEMNDFQTFQESFEIMQEKLIQAQSKEKELLIIIQTLEDQNSYLQSEVQSKDDKLSDLTSVISNLTERLTKQKSVVTMDTNGTGRNGKHTGSEILFYPQMGFVNKNNNNNNNNDADDELEFEAIETAYKSPSKHVNLNEQNKFTQSSPSKQTQLNEQNISPSKQVKLNEQNLFTSKQVQLNEQDLFTQLSEEAYNSETTLSTDSEELPPISLQEADSQTQIIPTDDVSIDEWSHASEDNGHTPESPKVSPIPTPDNTPLKRTPDLFLIRYNYDPLVSSPNPHPEQELPLTAGNCIYIYGTPDEDGFYMGELTGGKTGLVPSNFVERMKLGSSVETELKDTIIPQTDNPSLEDLGTMGPLDLYIQTQTDPNSLVHAYNSNLSNIVEEDESLLDGSILTRISGNISSTDSISKSQTENNSSNESLDKITDIQTPIPSPLHIPKTRDIRVKYTESDVELTWPVPQQISDPIQGYHISIGTEITHFIEGSTNTKFSLSTLQDKLTPGKYTLVVCTVTNHGYSDPTECTVDTTIIPPPTNLNITRDESTVLISWCSPDTNTLTSPLVSFEVYLNEVILSVVDFSDFLVNKGVSIPRTKLLEFYESSPDQNMDITIRSLLSNGRISPLSESLSLPLLMLTRTDSISGAMTNVDTESSEECSKHSTSSESELLEVFRKSSVETDQLFKAKRNISLEFTEVTNKPPINHRTALAQSIGGSNQRQSFTPNEYDLFSELEAQGESDLTPEMFSVEQTQSGSDNDDETHYEFPMDSTVTYYVALYDYNPTNQSPETGDEKNELPLKKGEVLAIFGLIDEDGFFTGQVDSKVGLVPYNLVEKIKICEISGETSSALLFQATKQAFPARNFKALYSYNPNTDSPNCEDLDDELSFHSGTSISIYGDVHDDGFFIGERDGEMGYVPSNFIEPIDIVKSHTEQQMAESPKGATPVESHKPTKNILSKTKGILRSLSKKS